MYVKKTQINCKQKLMYIFKEKVGGSSFSFRRFRASLFFLWVKKFIVRGESIFI